MMEGCGAMTTHQIVLLVYAILLEAGGLMGLIKAGSRASIVASSIIAAIVLLFAFTTLLSYAWVVLVFLILFFGMRFAKSKKFMPNGMMLILTVVALALIKVL
jgi:uncharacterized membrane protein (UPF0136 family)